ncbi:Amuc_1101 family PilM-like pilus complex protein [Prosthecobacter dejongeii]|uniref:Type IV pilus assembly protein PilM n=1 Tax=Prosthecobacter dejongeii TaxID=48465 RepID=A0A7W7YPN5_9BACT|nr:type IV pilus assembly protein PilM [Prosthecobacter dejongeii]MBB5039882.1 type IV pilus assembly protein PilM [Prosthecobacter dejongeii]
MADSKSIAVLNLGSQRLSGAIFSKSGGDLVLKKYEFLDMSGDPTVDASRIPQLRVGVQEIASRLKLKGSSVNYAVAGHTVFSRFVKLPPVQGDRMDQIVEFEARQNVPFPINEVIWDYEVVSELGETEVIIVAIKSDSLNETNDTVKEAGLKTSCVDLAPLALYNAFRYSYPDVDEPAVIIDLGARSTNLVFVEEGRFFTRNVLVGGASITNAISKEFSISFSEAEQQKISVGFVAQGGAVEEHSDPAIAALSKVIRNAATRLHGEIMRTINYYRTQQGGSQPKRVFVCGGGALLGNMTLFLEEKLKLPVEIFNPLRGVQLDRGVNADAANNDAPFLSEVVGLALRSAGGCPSEIELVPDVVANARDAARRAPALVLAGVCLWSALGAGMLYFQNAERVTQEQLSSMQQENNRLTALANQIRQQDGALAQSIALVTPLTEAVGDRSYWVRLLNKINNAFDNDLIWLTVVEPLKDGKPITPALFEQEESSPESTAKAVPGKPVYELRIQGLYRKNDEGEQVVYRFATALAKMGDFAAEKFEEKRANYVSAESGVEEDRYAYKFNIKLPLQQPIKFTN